MTTQPGTAEERPETPENGDSLPGLGVLLGAVAFLGGLAALWVFVFGGG